MSPICPLDMFVVGSRALMDNLEMSPNSYKQELRKGVGLIQRELGQLKHKCLFPECGSDAINSHSQQKESQLRSIAKQGHVYRLDNNMYRAVSNKGKEMKLWGIGEVSVFKGFCEFHDEAIFRPIEKKALETNDSQQAFLLFLRAVCYEFCQKRKGYEYWTRFCELLSRLGSPVYDEAVVMKEGVKKFVELDSVHYMTQLWDALQEEEYDVLEGVWLKVDANLGASSACLFSPFLDDYYESVHTQLAYAGPPILSFNLIPSDKETHVVASWFREDSRHCVWVNELLETETGLVKFINLGAVAQSEDTCFSPVLWNSISTGLKKRALKAMEHDLWRGKLDEIPLVVRV